MSRTPKEKTEWNRVNGKNKNGYLGVKAVRFESHINDPSGKKVYCGSGRTAEIAARKYDIKAREMYGDDAVLNFPGEYFTDFPTPTKTRMDTDILLEAIHSAVKIDSISTMDRCTTDTAKGEFAARYPGSSRAQHMAFKRRLDILLKSGKITLSQSKRAIILTPQCS